MHVYESGITFLVQVHISLVIFRVTMEVVCMPFSAVQSTWATICRLCLSVPKYRITMYFTCELTGQVLELTHALHPTMGRD